MSLLLILTKMIYSILQIVISNTGVLKMLHKSDIAYIEQTVDKLSKA